MSRESNRELFRADVKGYLTKEIHPAEAFLLGFLKESWPALRVLDLGVGAGRTAWFLAPLCSEYFGVDYAAEMIEACQNTIGETESVHFLVGDARNLSNFGPETFDLVVFSYNGIDCVDYTDRLRILDEVVRLLVPGGIFFFSSHSLTIFPFLPKRPRVVWSRPLRSLKRQLEAYRSRCFFSNANAVALSSEVQVCGWTIMIDQAHDYSLLSYYTTPESQAEQLRAKGLALIQALDTQGKPVLDVKSPKADWWFSYLCRKLTRDQRSGVPSAGC